MSIPPEVQRQIVDLFDEAANAYDRVDGIDYFGPIADGLLEQLAPQAGERTLDVGCGSGALLVSLARSVAPNGRATGIDAAPSMVVRAREEAAAQSVKVEVLVGDAQAPDFPPESFDVVGSSLVLFFLSDPVAALAAWRELLVDGGRVGISTFRGFNDSWHPVNAVFDAFTPPADPNPRAPAASSPFASDEGVEKLLGAAGYRGVRTVCSSISVRFDDVDQWERWSRSHGQLRRWKMVPLERLPEVRTAAADALELTRDANGRMGFDQQIRYTLGRR